MLPRRRKPSTVGRTGARNELGAQGEILAADFLLQNGYEIVERNWQGWWGEIDIVAKRGDTVYAVEVKKRAVYSENFNLELNNVWQRQKFLKCAKALEAYCPDYFIAFGCVFIEGDTIWWKNWQ